MENEGENMLDDRVARLEALVDKLVNTIKDQATTAGAGPAVHDSEINPGNPKPREESVTSTKFMKRNPMILDGTGEPEVADDWILDMERIFRALPCTEQQKVTFAADTLKGDAQRWWVE